eukprot:CAMPEP_0177674886 /NCGR_PEP_ID=MMETSP0447-20121125/26850_1 /TAXON_ID=0 /ORGANISM="Stygamoeba regulata, Strain BSH-02190019" /LENGTH=118 /DNA_ID=CAMNT_0019183123 /DNA_START=134 /DNA_END=487 /DNA_ORIENTATION=+
MTTPMEVENWVEEQDEHRHPNSITPNSGGGTAEGGGAGEDHLLAVGTVSRGGRRNSTGGVVQTGISALLSARDAAASLFSSGRVAQAPSSSNERYPSSSSRYAATVEDAAASDHVEYN